MTDDEPTIILELTPQEAALIFEMSVTYSWTRGPYGERVRDLYHALRAVEYLMRDHLNIQTVTQFGELDPGAIWLDD